MPQFFAFGQVDKCGINCAYEDNLFVGSVDVSQCGDQVWSAWYPFGVVERVAVWGRNRLNQFACAIGDENAFVCCIVWTDKLLACFSAKVQECGAFWAVLCEAYIACLFLRIPDVVLLPITYAEALCSCDWEAVVLGDSSVEGAVKNLLWCAELVVCKSDLPCTLR